MPYDNDGMRKDNNNNNNNNNGNNKNNIASVLTPNLKE